MLARGIAVSGSDAKDSRALEGLRALGARCHVGHAAEQVRDADTLVVSTAVREDNPEVVEARERGLRILPRSAALESVMQGRQRRRRRRHARQDHDHLAAHRRAPALRRRPVVRHRRRAQRVRVQRPRRQRRRLRRRGRRERRCVPGLLAVRRPGDQRRGRPPRQLGHRGGLPRGVRDVPRPDRPGRLPGGLRRRRRGPPTWWWRPARAAWPRWRWGSRRRRTCGPRRSTFAGSTSTFTVVDRGRRLGEVSLQIPGRHYVLDALAALAAGLRLGFSFADLKRGLEAFTGTRRRMELKGEVAGVRVYDSYAHHPNEIARRPPGCAGPGR